MTGLDDRAIARWRLHSQRLAGRAFSSPVDVVGGLLGVQAENYLQTCWAVADRVREALVEDDLHRELDDGSILRTHVLRPTWHFVLADDIRWLLELTAPRVRRSHVVMAREDGLEREAVTAGVDRIVTTVAAEGPRTRAQLALRLAEAGLPSRGRPLAILLGEAELDALVCSGPRQDGEHTWALLDERAPATRPLERDEALAEIARRYFAGHGPATERDLAYWGTLTLTDVRRGIAAAGPSLDSAVVGDRTYWFTESPPSGTVSPRGHLLMRLDEYHNGYQDSRWALDADGLLPRGRPSNMGMALVDGQQVGGMLRTVEPDAVRFEVDLVRDLTDAEESALHDAAERYGAFLARRPDLVLG